VGQLHFDTFTLGARHYSNSAEPPYTQGFLHGDIAEVLLYDRVLDESEKRTVTKLLTEKHAALLALAPGAGEAAQMLVAVSNPPPIQVFLPGFEVRELPVTLPNINNVKYRPDGKLVAVGYNGKVYLLTDTDGDGLEDKATPFWDQETTRSPIGLALTRPGDPRGQGVFLPAKGKLSLILDTNGDDRADLEMAAATWTEKSEQQGVDALGVALDGQGNVYFGLGTASYTGAYLVDAATGASRYRLNSERGTILKLAPDFSRREILCTGVRFTVALAFNGEGDLFCTDQEGATWLPNGNPLDELLHIQPGRHYGFPPRHPKHLPNVIDEPSVFDYAPQHQSTCGLNFNELPPGAQPVVPGRVCFGPPEWRGDALVAGYSRGKLYRTKLVKTPRGYVGQNQLLACLQALTVDACVSPRGDLIVATHSGQPDWGSGPNGMGKLYQIRYVERDLPQPVLAWWANPTQLEIAFDRPLQPARLKQLTRLAALTQGKHVYAGDRFETLRPGYQVIYDQLSAARRDVPILSANLSADGRTLRLITAPQQAALHYALTMPAAIVGQDDPAAFSTAPAAASVAAVSRVRRTDADIDLLTELTGVETQWSAQNGAPGWAGWLPHVNLAVSRALTRSSFQHNQLWKNLQTNGTLTLRGQLDLWRMLQPATQPGAALDYEPPVEEVTIRLTSPVAGQVRFGDESAHPLQRDGAQWIASYSTRAEENRWVPFVITIESGPETSALDLAWSTTLDPQTFRPFPLRRLLVPWASPAPLGTPARVSETAVVPELAGGHWLRGRRLFFSETLACSKCHRMRGEGGEAGPDLSNLVYRDYHSVLKDIREPNNAINPDHIAYQVERADGETFTAILKTETREQLTFADATGRPIALPRTQIRSIKPATVSLMPEGLLQGLNAEQLRDLMTFLLTEPLQPAALEALGAPPPRTLAEVKAVWSAGLASPVESRPGRDSGQAPFRVVLCAGPKDHGPGEHDYPLWQTRWAKLLGLAEGVTADLAQRWPSAEQLREANTIVFYSNNPDWNADRSKELGAFLARGGGVVFLHWAVEGQKHVEALAEHIGLAWRDGAAKFRHGPLSLALRKHPLSAGFGKLDFVDESYWQLTGDPGRVDLIATGVEEGAPRPLIWTRTSGRGRVFVSILGHYSWTFDDPLFRLLILRGICWTGGQPMDRLSELATIGARLGNPEVQVKSAPAEADRAAAGR
jgi:putative heme-binding domain-containing protein